LLDSLLQETMKGAILIISSLAATLAGPQYLVNRETSVEGRQFSEDPIINYAGWGFIAGLADYFIRDLLTPTTTTTTTVAPTTTTTTAAPAAGGRKKMDKKEKNQRKERKQKKAERKAAKLAAKRKAAEEEMKKAEQIADDNMSEEQVDETAGATVEV